MISEPPYKKPPLDRQAPSRQMAGIYRRAEAPSRKKKRSGGPLTSTEDVVLEAVKLGYKIADEQILKGQDFARRLRGASLSSDAGDVGDLVDHGMRLARQFAILLVEMTETTLQGPAMARAFARGANESRAPTSAASCETIGLKTSEPTASASYSLPIEVKSRRPTRVSLVLSATLTTLPDVYPLYRARDKQALHGVEITGSLETGFVLAVEVSDEQPPGDYQGYAIDPASGKPLGTIVVSVKSQP